MDEYLKGIDCVRLSTLRKKFGEELADHFGKNQRDYGFGFCAVCNWYARSAEGRGVCDGCLEEE